MQAIELYDIKRAPIPDDLDRESNIKRLEARRKPTKDIDQWVDIADYQETTLRLNVCGFFNITVPWWKRWLTYSTWEWVIIIVTVVLSIMAFISSLINMWPELPKMFGSLISVANAAEITKIPNPSWNYAHLKDFGITLFVMILCLYSAAVCYHSKLESRRKFAQDTVKFILGFLSGRGMR